MNVIKIKCVICFNPVVERAHIRTRGAGAKWKENEYVYLCRKHHHEQHLVGIKTFAEKYKSYMNEIKKKGWEFFNGRLVKASN